MSAVVLDDIERAARLLLDGGVVAFPTGTVYGIGASILREDAVHKLYGIKKRDIRRPLAVQVSSYKQARKLISCEIPLGAMKLWESKYFGLVTIVLPRAEFVPHFVTSGKDSIAIRIPHHPIAAKLLTIADIPLAVTSANISGDMSVATEAFGIKKLFGSSVDMVLDGGAELSVDSSIISFLNQNEIRLLREKAISKATIESIIGMDVSYAG